MKSFYKQNLIEAGLDEVARGCLFGRVYAATVIWRNEKDLNTLLNKLNIKKMIIQDSKKLNHKKRIILRDYIETVALDYSVGWVCEKEVDKLNIRNATFKAMHIALDNLTLKPESLIVDGNDFAIYKITNHKCIIKGDNTYNSIAAASIIAKVAHDEYIEKLIRDTPELKKYDIHNNMGYGTKKHIDAIKEYGITDYHRKTFGICKQFKTNLKLIKN
jgi:ribonuclease HII